MKHGSNTVYDWHQGYVHCPHCEREIPLEVEFEIDIEYETSMNGHGGTEVIIDPLVHSEVYRS